MVLRCFVHVCLVRCYILGHVSHRPCHCMSFLSKASRFAPAFRYVLKANPLPKHPIEVHICPCKCPLAVACRQLHQIVSRRAHAVRAFAVPESKSSGISFRASAFFLWHPIEVTLCVCQCPLAVAGCISPRALKVLHFKSTWQE